MSILLSPFLIKTVYAQAFMVHLSVHLTDFSKKQQQTYMISTLLTGSKIVTAKLQRKERKVNRASHTVSPISKLRTPHHILHITHPLYYVYWATYTYIAVQCCAVQCSGLQTRWTRPNEKRNVLLRPTAGERNPHDLIFLGAARKVLRL